ncbi:single-stranded DNA-binding protein [Candidatus Woesebacteria bacterium]|jgi:single-strand DNA-binding protein|nr:single-stranded DNA-binding protein [Candidatus Woesebacteria bacterium]
MSSKSLNKVTLIGNLTRDPELKYTPQGTAVCSFGVATNRGWTTKTGETKEDVQFHRIVAWQKLAELCANLLAKGRKIYLEGRITYRSFEGKDGVQRQLTEIVMDDFVLFDDRRKGEDGAPSADDSAMPEAEAMEDEVPVDEPALDKVEPDDIPF